MSLTSVYIPIPNASLAYTFQSEAHALDGWGKQHVEIEAQEMHSL